MHEDRGDLFDYPADLVVITTNGSVTAAGVAVMGAGCARQARDIWPGLAQRLGRMLLDTGNHVHLLETPPIGYHLASFPVKRVWQEPASLELVERSAAELVALCDRHGYEQVVLPRPGCGNGWLAWPAVRGRLRKLLDRRFTVITYPLPTGQPPTARTA
jgi:hypothetical protein